MRGARAFRAFRAAPLAALALAAALAITPARAEDASPAIDWAREFEALQDGLVHNYANFEYTLTDRRVDLPRLAADARERLADATTDAARRGVLDDLLRQFRDPHLFIEWLPPDANGKESACPAALTAARRPGIAFRRLPGFVAIDDPRARLFDAGVLRSTDAPTLGIVRIALFLERAYPAACAEAASATGVDGDAPCDDACTGRLLPRIAHRLDASLQWTVSRLERAGAKVLVVDVTNNGGGSDWAEIVARMLGGPLASARVGMLRHPAWQAWLEERLQALEAERTADARDRERVERARADVRTALHAIAQPCDLSPAWTDDALALGDRPLPCTNLVTRGVYATGLEPRGSAVHVPPRALDALLFHPAQYGAYPVGVARIPLRVLVDRETHSAAEQFAAVLRDNHRARLVGEPTAGAGCGTYTSAGTSFTLPQTRARVHVPDCVRLRADGSNERRGIVPDRLVPWAPSDSAYQRARKALAALRAD